MRSGWLDSRFVRSAVVIYSLSAGAWADQADARPPSGDVAIMKALLRDVIFPAREVVSPVGSLRIVALSDLTLVQCPPKPESPCVSEDVFRAAEREASMGTWSFELARALRPATTSGLKLERFEYPGFVMGALTEFQSTLPSPAPLTISRPVVMGDKALLYVQFAHTYTWLVLLTAKDSDWKVTARVQLTFS